MRIVHGKGFFKKLTKQFEQGKRTVNALVYGLTDYNKSVRDVLKVYGNMPITSIKICRQPVSGAVQAAMNAVSLGSFNKRIERASYDEIFHLFALITINGTVLTLDKQAQIMLKVGSKPYKDSMDVSGPFSNLNTMLQNTKDAMGDRFFTYDAKSNNCQVFISSFLKANQKINPQLNEFIMQDVSSLFDPSLESKSNFVTNLGSKIATLQYGGDV